jgi:multimeric flavodoxin WrbA
VSKKVLVIVSSPRKGGNSEKLCDEFARGAREAGHEVEKVSLAAKRIGYCSGCGACQSSHECVKKDDMAALLERMVAADAIVLSTPVYFYTMCAQMKTLIDRCVARYTEISGKDFYFIATAADASKAALERTVEEFRGFAACLEGATERGVVYGTGAWEAGAIVGSPAMKRAYELGKKA